MADFYRLTLIPNFNKAVLVATPTADGVAANVDLTAYNAEGLHAAHYFADTDLVEVEFVKPANKTMTRAEFEATYGALVGTALEATQKAQAELEAAAAAEAANAP